MTYDISFLLIWLFLAAVLGAVFAWRTYEPGPQTPVFEGWVRRAAIAWLVALAIVVLHLLSGRLAFWLETAVLFCVAYVVGALIGGAARGLRAEA